VDVVVVPAVPGPRRVHDGVWRDETVQMAVITRSIASCRGRIARLEAHGRQELRVMTTGVDFLRQINRERYQRKCQKKGRRGVPNPGGGVPWLGRDLRRTVARLRSSGGRSWAPWGLPGHIDRGESERRLMPTYSRGEASE
jgi:hypothetical protein